MNNTRNENNNDNINISNINTIEIANNYTNPNIAPQLVSDQYQQDSYSTPK